MEQALIKLGLSEKEAKVYLATLELGESTVQNLAKKSGVNRATTYVILEKLMGLGLVSSIEQDKKTKFIAESPTELVNILEEQKREIDGRRRHLDEVMNQLLAVHNAKKGKPTVRYFEGADGLEALDRLDQEKISTISNETLSIFPMDLVEELFPGRRKVAVDYRIKNKIKARTIYTHKNGPVADAVNAAELREAIFIPREELPINATVQIHPKWGVKIFNFDKANLFGVLIQSPTVADNMSKLFELAWRGAKGRSGKN